MMSWVAMDRIVQREAASDPKSREQIAGRPLRSDARYLSDQELLAKLRAFGVEMDRPTLAQLSDEFLSAERIAEPLIERYVSETKRRGVECDWIWICLCTLWERWLPHKPSFEMLDDKIQAGYELVKSRNTVSACRVWLEAWKDVLHLMDKARLQSIIEFDELFRGTEAATGSRALSGPT